MRLSGQFLTNINSAILEQLCEIAPLVAKKIQVFGLMSMKA